MGKNKAALIVGAAAMAVVAWQGAPAGQKAPARTVGQKVTGPRAVYWIDADTESGLPIGGGAPSMGDMMRMMSGGGGGFAQKRLFLRLASNEGPATTKYEAQHVPPATLDGGRALQLAFERVAKKPEPGTPGVSEAVHGKARLIVYWGCGEHVGPGQPRTVELSSADPLAGAKQVAALLNPAVTLDRQVAPLPSEWRSYAEWPTGKSRRTFPAAASLVGDHRVTSAFSPPIALSLAAQQDFLPPFAVTGNRVGPGGAVPLGWAPLPRTGAVAATVIGGTSDGAVVFWANSLAAMRWAAIAPDYLTAADIARLTGNGTLLRGDAPGCTIPAEVVKAIAGGGLYRLNGYAADSSLSYPPRPADPKQPWNIEWTAKVRYRTLASGMIGQEMPGMDAGEQGDASKPQKKKGGLFGRLKDVVKP